MFCPNCGAECKDGAKFCGKCGTSLEKYNNTSAQPSQETVADTLQQETNVQQETEAQQETNVQQETEAQQETNVQQGAEVSHDAESQQAEVQQEVEVTGEQENGTSINKEQEDDSLETQNQVDEQIDNLGNNVAQGDNGQQAAQGQPGFIQFGQQPAQGQPGPVQFGQQAAQGQPGPTQFGQQTAQGQPGPAQFSQQTAQGQPGPAQFGQQAAQGQPGPAQFGQQAAQGQPGPAQFGQQTAQGQPGPAQFGQQTAQGQPGPVQFGQQPKQKKPHKPLSKKVIGIITAAAVAVIAIIVFVCVGISGSGYKKTAEEYVKAYTTGDWEKAYKCVEYPESEYLTLDAFKAANANTKTKKVKSVNAKQSTTSSTVDSIEVNVAVKYEDGTTDNYTIAMEESSNYMLFFKRYKVSPEYEVCKDYEISAPKGLKVKINGVDVVSEEKSGKNSYSTSYTVPYVFRGNNEISVSGDNIEEYKTTEEITYDKSSLYLGTDIIEIKEDVLNNVKAQAQKDFEKIIQAAVANKNFSEIKDMCIDSKNSKAESTYNKSVKDSCHSTYKDITKYQLSNVKSELRSEDYMFDSDDGQQYLQVRLSYDASGQYVYKSYGDEVKDAQSSDQTASLTYKYSDGKWLISDMSIYISLY